MLTSRRISGRVSLLVCSLLLAILACARANVPPPAGIGSGGITTPSPQPVTSMAVFTLVPTVTPSGDETATPAAPEPVVSPTFPATPTQDATQTSETILYETQPGDTLRAVAIRFGVTVDDVQSPEPLPDGNVLLDPGMLLVIPARLGGTGPAEKLIPDSELVFSPHATDFDPVPFVQEQGGYLSRYREYVGTQWRSGGEVVALVARDNSVNPRILLALLEHEAGWVTGKEAPSGDAFKYPLRELDPRIQGLFRQLTWLANELGNGYYGWRDGSLSTLRLLDGTSIRLAPDLNAGTVALQHYFSLRYGFEDWNRHAGPEGILGTYESFFGDPWAYDYPLFEPGVEQPEMILPFMPNRVWAYTGGPHGAWERESAWAAIDFAPPTSEHGCVPSDEWVVAAAPGFVVRSGEGVVVLDLDGDGREQSGWALLYLHIAEAERVPVGALLEQGDKIGHPSCEGGIATGTHVHLARKYNGEWILADGPLPFEMSGWVAVAGSKPYQGALVKGDQVVLACVCATQETYIQR
jgi:LasA protease